MKRKTLYGVCLAFSLWGLSSCSKFLDVEPEEVLLKEQMYRNIFDADAAVIGVYGKFLGSINCDATGRSVLTRNQ
jgi:hypothetical protein